MSVGPTPLEIFRAKGIPHRRMEDWKYTDLRQLVDAEEVEADAGTAPDIDVICPPGLPVEYLSLDEYGFPEWAARLVAEIPVDSPMDAAARAFTSEEILRIGKNARAEEPLRIQFRGRGRSRLFIFVEEGAEFTLVETCQNNATDKKLTNSSIGIWLSEGAKLTHFRQVPFAGENVDVQTTTVIQEKNSLYRMRVLHGGAKLSRTEFNVVLKGEGAEADLSGVSVLGDKAHADITTRIDHAVPNTTSRQLFKKVAGGKSRAVYQGKIIVREGAIGSDSRQTAKALLLSNQAEADLKPELEILADDVKCAHGAAVGDLDADSLFYLRSRGIPESEARGLLIHAFLQEVVDGIEDEGLRGTAVEFIDDGLARAMESAS